MPHCPYCGQPMPAGSHFCGSCGRLSSPVDDAASPGFPQPTLASPGGVSLFPGDAAGPVYAGFWLRAVAYLLDQIVLSAALFLVLFIFGVALAIGLSVAGSKPFEPKGWGPIITVLVYAVAIPTFWLYSSLMESSRWQASLGKKALGLAVTDLDGRRISFGRATGRHFAKILSSLLFGAGFVMAGFSQRKQALHDQIASCLVIRKV